MSLIARSLRRTLSLRAILLASLAQNLPAQRAYYDPVPETVLSARLDRVAPRNPDRARTLKVLFGEAGCAKLTEQTVGAPFTPNIICTLPGTGPSTIVVGARYDNYWGGDGAVNNWTGSSMLPSLYESLARTPREHTLVFVGFSVQSRGFTGANVYVSGLKPAERANLKAVVTLSSLGVGPLKVSWLKPESHLGDVLHMVTREMNRPLPPVAADAVALSDSSSFSSREIPTIGLSSVTHKTRRFTQAADRLSVIDRASYFESYQLIAAYLAYLDASWAEFSPPPQR